MLGLEDKVVIVTGGNRGIGAAIVGVLSDWGAKVAYNYRSEPGQQGDNILPVQCDVTDPDAVENFYKQVEDQFGEIYGVVANAGVIKDSLVHKMSEEDWEYVVNINLTGVFHTLKPYFARKTKKQKVKDVYAGVESQDENLSVKDRTFIDNGAVVIISSLGGQRGNLGQVNYAATKGGVIAMTKTLALEGARFGVRCNSVAPGYTVTDIIKGIPEKVVARLVQEVPLLRFADPKEMAWAAGFLLSPQASSYITGQTLAVNGGQYMAS